MENIEKTVKPKTQISNTQKQNKKFNNVDSKQY